MKFQSLILLLLISLASATMNQATPPDDWTPIKNISDPTVIAIARFAVSEYNDQNGAKLEFEKLIKGESQLLPRMETQTYRLTLSAKDGSSSNNYDAVVLDTMSKYSWKLISFKRV
ncbi:unnamed protein product [Vicia faba]|uniref:Cystatin domain-containing protein n=1 Tax=Vicia faba TaxID=3906 RepID=A0AAV0ZRE5_VICFA|nr:unnamed protein product [Vicia faba]